MNTIFLFCYVFRDTPMLHPLVSDVRSLICFLERNAAMMLA
jgi:hypothetical protein